MKTCGAVLLGTILLGSATAEAQFIKPETLLTVADVSRITKVPGVKTVPQDPIKGASGDLNFADAKGELLLSLAMQQPASFQAAKRRRAPPSPASATRPTNTRKTPGGGLPPFILIFRQGPYGVMLTSFFEPGQSASRSAGSAQGTGAGHHRPASETEAEIRGGRGLVSIIPYERRHDWRGAPSPH